MLGCLGNFMDRRLPASFSGAPDEPTGIQPIALQFFGSGGFQPVFRERRLSASFFGVADLIVGANSVQFCLKWI